MSGLTIRARFRPEPVVHKPPVSRAARVLALAHHVERLVEEGEVESYAAVARAFGLTRARLTQILALTLLSPDIQERVAVGELGLSPRALRRVVAEQQWEKQEAVVSAAAGGDA